AKNSIPEQAQIDQGESNEYHLDVEIRIRECPRRISDHKDHTGRRIDPEPNPQYRNKLLHGSQRQRRCNTENPKIDSGANPNGNAHSNRVKEQDGGKCEYRTRFTDPLRESQLLQPK